MIFKKTSSLLLIKDIQEGLGFAGAFIMGRSGFWGKGVLPQIGLHEAVEVYQVTPVEPHLALPPPTFGGAGVGGAGGGDWCEVCQGGCRSEEIGLIYQI